MWYKIKRIYIWEQLVRPKQTFDAGIYHNATLWLISMSSNWSSWITIADKNLWATTVRNYWDTDTAANAWTMYQRWNNYWFAWNATLTTTPNKQNVSWYWPSNYYNSSTFVWDSTWNWMSWRWTSNNQDMRWCVTWTNAARKWPCSTWWHIPSKQDWISMIEVWAALWARTWNSSSQRVSWDFTKNTKISNTNWRYSYNWNFAQVWWYYWTSDADASQQLTYFSLIWSYLVWFWLDNNNYWMFIRPFKNSPVVPDDTWNKIYPVEVAPVNETFSYTWSDQVWTVPYTQDYIITCKWAGWYNTSWWLGQWTFTLNAWDKLSIVVWSTWYWRTAGGYWFWGSASWWANSAGSWLSWVFTWDTAVTANDAARALVIWWWAWWMSSNTNSWEWWQWWWTTWWTWTGRYWTAWAWGTQTWRWSWGNAWSWQFQWWNWSWSYGYGWGWWRRGGNGSIWDSSADDDKWGWGGSGYVHSSATNPTLTKWWWSNIRTNWEVTIVSVNQ